MSGLRIFGVVLAITCVQSAFALNTTTVSSTTNVTQDSASGISTEQATSSKPSKLITNATSPVLLTLSTSSGGTPPTQPPSTTVSPSKTSSTIYASTQAAYLTTTSNASIPWNYVSFGLFGVVSILLIALIITTVCTYKIKQKLKQCSTTLYPNLPGHQPPNEYLDLEASDKHYHHANVELTGIQELHEFETPGLRREPVPEKPPRRQPPPPPTSNPPTTKKQGKAANGNVSKKTENGEQVNGGFEMEETKPTRSANPTPLMGVNDLYHTDDGVYEEYEEKETHAGFDMEDGRPYEEPVSKHAIQPPDPGPDMFAQEGMHRQDSSTGLPDIPTRTNADAKQSKHKMPLGVADDDDGFNAADFDQTGIPLATMNFDDTQYFGDFDASGTHVNFDMDVEGRDSFVDIPNHSYHVLEKLPDDDKFTMVETGAAVVNTNIPTEADERGLYESYEAGFVPKESVNAVPIADNFGQCFDHVDGNGDTKKENGISEEEDHDYENPPFPIVPPRRDLQRKHSESENASASIDAADAVLRMKTDPEDTSSENDIRLKKGKSLRASKIGSLNETYFLDINDKPTTLEEQDAHADHPIMTEPIIGVSLVTTDAANVSGENAMLVDLPASEGNYVNTSGIPTVSAVNMLDDYENVPAGLGGKNELAIAEPTNPVPMTNLLDNYENFPGNFGTDIGNSSGDQPLVEPMTNLLDNCENSPTILVRDDGNVITDQQVAEPSTIKPGSYENVPPSMDLAGIYANLTPGNNTDLLNGVFMTDETVDQGSD